MMKVSFLFRILSLILSVILLAGIVCSCKKSGDGTLTDNSSNVVSTTGDTEINAMNILGENDLGGTTITFYLRSYGGIWDIKSLYADSILSDTINDAVYERNETLKAQYNFNIAVEESASQSYPTRIINWVMAGECPADVITAGGYDMAKIAVQGVLRDLKHVEGLDLEREWWNTTLNAQMSIANTLFYASGDIICEDNMAVRCLFFNKTFAENMGFAPESIYNMVENNEWTMEKMFQMASVCYSDRDDVEGQSKGDTFGLSVQKVIAHYIFMTAAGVRITDKNANDIPEVVLGSSNDITITDQIGTYLNRDNSVYCEDDGVVHASFKKNNALFLAEVLGTVVTMRNWDVKFGILPMPKYSTEQPTYNHFADGNCLNLLAIPTGNNAKLDKIAFVLEAMCIESNKTLNPAFYDRALRGRYSYDVESSSMLDIILNTMFIENANLYKGDKESDGWGIIQSELRDAVNSGSSISGVVASYKELTGTLINKTVTKLKDISMAQSY